MALEYAVQQKITNDMTLIKSPIHTKLINALQSRLQKVIRKTLFSTSRKLLMKNVLQLIVILKKLVIQ